MPDRAAGACVRLLVGFFGIVASILNPTLGSSIFLLCAVTLTTLQRKGEVTRTLLPAFVGGKVILAFVAFLTSQLVAKPL